MLGGAFNPPHIGHLLLAQEARWQLELDSVLLMVTGRAPHKQIEPEPGPGVRLELAELAAREEPGVEASAMELDGEGPSYTYLTLERLREQDGSRETYLLLGADAVAGLESWEKPERVLELARLAVVPRQSVEPSAVTAALERLDAADRAEMIEMPLCGVSSTLIRDRAAAERPLRHLVPDRVAEEIAKRGLYR